MPSGITEIYMKLSLGLNDGVKPDPITVDKACMTSYIDISMLSNNDIILEV
jgi:hypothetical protein